MAKKCRNCKMPFEPTYNSTQVVCSPRCAIDLSRVKKRKEFDKETRERKKALKADDRRHWIKECQKSFNRMIRERDRDLPCVSCRRYDGEINDVFTGGKWDCGHYLTVGAHPELRFTEINGNRQCKSCNAGSGKYTGKEKTVQQSYREILISRIGQDQVDWLEGPHDPAKWTVEDLKRMKKDFDRRYREMRDANG